VDQFLSVENSRLLLGHYRAGRLYEIEKWIALGKSLKVEPNSRKKPLQVSIESGFHSLVELLLRHESSQEMKNQALSLALSEKRLDLIQLMVNYGAEIRATPFVDVLRLWEPTIIQFFLDNGADVVTGYPFTIAFKEKIRTALRPFVEFRKTHSELAAALQDQLDRALRHFAYEGDLKWINLLFWAGADPRSCGPVLDNDDDPECFTTAIKEACYKGNLDALKKFKVDPLKDNLTELLACASIFKSREVIRFLIKLGATPNDRANGGSSILHQHLCHFDFHNFEAGRGNRLISKYEVRDNLECIEELVKNGALWQPENRNEMNYVRRSLLKCEPSVMVEIVKLFSRHHASSSEPNLALTFRNHFGK
jgi:hypothetical protein